MTRVDKLLGPLAFVGLVVVVVLLFNCYRIYTAEEQRRKEQGCEYYRDSSLKNVPVKCLPHFFPPEDAGTPRGPKRIFYCVDSPMCKDWKDDSLVAP